MGFGVGGVGVKGRLGGGGGGWWVWALGLDLGLRVWHSEGLGLSFWGKGADAAATPSPNQFRGACNASHSGVISP